MLAKQLSVFIENRQGRLVEILEQLKKSNVNILSLSLADTTEYGLLRFIVNDAEEGKKALQNSGYSTMVTKVLIVKVSHKSGSLQNNLVLLANNGINVEYMYGLSIDGSDAYIVIKTNDPEKADKILTENKIGTLSDEDIKKLQ